MNSRNRDILLWILWFCVFGIFYSLGETQYYMNNMAYTLIFLCAISGFVVGIFWFLSPPEGSEKIEP